MEFGWLLRSLTFVVRFLDRLRVVIAESRYKCGSCGWEQQSRFATVCVWGGGSSNTGSASHIHLCRKKKANIKVDTCYTSPVV